MTNSTPEPTSAPFSQPQADIKGVLDQIKAAIHHIETTKEAPKPDFFLEYAKNLESLHNLGVSKPEIGNMLRNIRADVLRENSQ